MVVASVEGLPKIPEDKVIPQTGELPVKEVDVLIIGGGPAGLSAAIELGKLGVNTLIVDDKDRLGGKLVLQPHKFFGSVKDSHAGTRGFEIGKILQDELLSLSSVEIWVNTTAVAVFSDHIVGVIKENQYQKIKPKEATPKILSSNNIDNMDWTQQIPEIRILQSQYHQIGQGLTILFMKLKAKL